MRLLIVGTLGGQLAVASRMAMDRGAAVTHADSIETALKTLRSGKGADLVMIDVAQPIAELIRRLESELIHIPVVACGTTTDARAAVEAIRAGAKEYIPLPPDPEMIAAVLAAVANDDRDMIWRDDSMGRVVKLAQQIAGSDASVLITGESGTGKEVLARGLHQASPRKGERFVAINCAAIPENLLESELFGYEKGAFTGAAKTTLGKIETANGGTLMLDEIGDLPMPLQAKLLRFLQERVIERIGGRQEIPVDVRIVCATHQDLKELIKAGRFREDLYYRLAEIIVTIPPLRARSGDAALLAHAFARRFAEEQHCPILPLSEDALRAIEAHPWPGNVRELENCMKRAVIMADGPQITREDIGLDQSASGDCDDSLDLRKVRDEAEKKAVLCALARVDGNVLKAAELLGVSRPTLYDLMHRFGLK